MTEPMHAIVALAPLWLPVVYEALRVRTLFTQRRKTKRWT
jgi:hypothetical protein